MAAIASGKEVREEVATNISGDLSEKRIADVTREWSSREYADEVIRVESIKGFLYAFGSELAVRRLAHKFRSFNVRYSQNMKSWYFCNERV